MSFYLLLGEVFLRLASKSSGSGELGGETCLLMLTACSGFDPETVVAVTAIPPRELLANNVPFLGGLPILLPVLENLVPPEVIPAVAAGDNELPLPPSFAGLKALPVLGDT